MKKVFAIGVLFLSAPLIYCQLSLDSLPGFVNSYSNHWMKDWYQAPSMIHFLDNFSEDVFVFNEANSGFGRADDLILSINNGSHRWSKFYLNNHRIDDILTPGTPILIPEPSETDVEIKPHRSIIRFNRHFQNKHMDLQYDRGAMGGWLPGADDIIHFIYGHNSPRDKNVRRPFDFRRMVQYQFMLEADFSLPKSDSTNLWHGLQILTGKRQHTFFDFGGLSGTYPEKYLSMDLKGQIDGKEWSYAAGLRYRDSYLAEYGLNREETSTLNTLFFTVFQSTPANSFIKNNGINIIFKNMKHNYPGFARNIIDQDGEGLNPWYPGQNLTGISHHLTTEYRLSENPDWKIQWESYNSFIHSDPQDDRSTHPVFYQTSAEDFRSIYVHENQFSSFSSFILENRIEVSFHQSLWNNSGELSLTGGPGLDGFALAGTSKLSLNFNASCRLSYAFRAVKAGLHISRRAVPYHYEHIRFLSEDHLSGEIYFWEDADGDRKFQEPEKGGLFRRTGGWVHSLGDNLKQPVVYNISLPVQFLLGKNWIIGFTGEYSSFRDLWTTDYAQAPDTYGSYHEVKGYSIYFQDPGNSPLYQVVPYRTDLIQEATGRESVLFDHPFSASGLLQISHFSPRWWFYFSFRAYMVPGYGDVGNGPLHNSFDAQSESLANPNTYIHYYGRLSVDRSFITKFALSYRASEILSGVFQIKYKDGQPFNFIETAILESAPGQNQVALWNEGIKGDNPFTGEFNSRTNGLWNIEVRLAFRPKIRSGELTLELMVYNLLDLGMSTREFTFAPAMAGDRAALDLEVPRGMSLGVRWSWH